MKKNHKLGMTANNKTVNVKEYDEKRHADTQLTQSDLLSTLMLPAPPSNALFLFYTQLIVVLPEHDDSELRLRCNRAQR
jgi:hypothetical protein